MFHDGFVYQSGPLQFHDMFHDMCPDLDRYRAPKTNHDKRISKQTNKLDMFHDMFVHQSGLSGHTLQNVHTTNHQSPIKRHPKNDMRRRATTMFHDMFVH